MLLTLFSGVALGFPNTAERLQNSESNVFVTNAGLSIPTLTNALTVGPSGPMLTQDFTFFDHMQSFLRERIPERIVHARGAGAKGTFTLEVDQSQYTVAKLFTQVGTQTDIIVRFSTVAGRAGSPEFLRDPRGFAIKHYTSEGNYDMVGLNFPFFAIRDAIRFPDLVRSTKIDPSTGTIEGWRVLDYLSHLPEATGFFTWVNDDTGIPLSFRHMNGFSVHTYKWVNAQGKNYLVRYRYVPRQGVKSFTSDEEAAKMNYAFATQDLHDAIANGTFPTWDMYVQIRAANQFGTTTGLGFDPLDATKDWPTDIIKPVRIGHFTLNKNLDSQFLEEEQVAFSPTRLIPGILPSDDKLLQGRFFAYPDAQRYRLGTNNQQIPVNQPKGCPFFNAGNVDEADGFMNIKPPNVETSVNYFPSAFSSRREANPRSGDNEVIVDFSKVRASVTTQVSNFQASSELTQAAARYATFDSARKERFAMRLAMGLADPGLDPKPQIRAIWQSRWSQVNANLGARVTTLLNEMLTVTGYQSSTFSPVSMSSSDTQNMRTAYQDFIRSSGFSVQPRTGFNSKFERMADLAKEAEATE